MNVYRNKLLNGLSLGKLKPDPMHFVFSFLLLVLQIQSRTICKLSRRLIFTWLIKLLYLQVLNHDDKSLSNEYNSVHQESIYLRMNRFFQVNLNFLQNSTNHQDYTIQKP